MHTSILGYVSNPRKSLVPTFLNNLQVPNLHCSEIRICVVYMYIHIYIIYIYIYITKSEPARIINFS